MEPGADDTATLAAPNQFDPFGISSTRIADATTDRQPKFDLNNANQFAVGTRVGDFEILELVGQGGVSHVFRARQCSLDRVVALKVTLHDAGVDPQSLTAHEGRTMASLSHDNIVPVFAEELTDTHRLLAMAFVSGPDLANLLESFGDQKSEDSSAIRDILAGRSRTQFACETAREIARALAYAHTQNVLHCDVKPANILFAESGRPLLSDFNVSVRNSNAADGPIGGTLAYMSPEHLGLVMGVSDQLHAEPVDERTDIYGLGLVLFQMLTGNWPFDERQAGTDPIQAAGVLRALRLNSKPTFPPGCRLSPGLQSIVCKCLAPADDRYQSAADLAADLDRYLANRPLQFASDPSLRERAVKAWRRHRLAIVAAVLVTAVLMFSVFSRGRIAKGPFDDSASAIELERKGSELAAAEEFEAAIPHLEEAVKRNGQLRIAHFNLGIAYFKTGRFVESVAAFDHVIDSGLTTSTVYAHRCAARFAAGDRPGADSDYRSAKATLTPSEEQDVNGLLDEYRRQLTSHRNPRAP